MVITGLPCFISVLSLYPGGSEAPRVITAPPRKGRGEAGGQRPPLQHWTEIFAVNGGPVRDRPLRERRQVPPSNGTAPRGRKARRDCSCRSRRSFNRHGAAAVGAQTRILVFPAPAGHCQMPVSRPRRPLVTLGRSKVTRPQAKLPHPCFRFRGIHVPLIRPLRGHLPPGEGLGRAATWGRPYRGKREQADNGGRTLCAPTEKSVIWPAGRPFGSGITDTAGG